MWNSRLKRLAEVRAEKEKEKAEEKEDPEEQFPEELPQQPREVLPESIDIAAFIQKSINIRTGFNFHDPKESISRHLLLPVQKSSLVSQLYRDDGKVSSAMVVRFASALGLRLEVGLVTAVLEDSSAKLKAELSRRKKRHHDFDSEPDPDEEEDGDGDADDPLSGLPVKTISEIVWLLKKELHALYRDIMKNEEDEKEVERANERKVDIPSYREKKVIAENLPDFERMLRVRLFGGRTRNEPGSGGGETGGSLIQPSVALSFPTMSAGTLTEDCADSRVSHLTVGARDRSDSRLSVAASLCSDFHPMKNPSVFRHFYPSKVSDETKKLPIFAQADKIMSMLSSRQVTVISGRTGTGKTTQVPLMVMDQFARDNLPCNIIVTQPRRLAAIGVARRVCADRGWNIGQLVGYHVGLDRRVSESTRLTYCTTGVFIEKIVSEKNLNSYTHVFLDEVHERDQDTDMALMLVRQMLRENSPKVKVILMSATVEVDKMVNYFNQNVHSLAAANMPGRVTVEVARYEIFEKYLDEFSDNSEQFRFDKEKPFLSNKVLAVAVKLLNILDPVWDALGSPITDPAVLCFLPGLEHINEMATIIRARLPDVEIKVLHSTVSGPEQELVLEPPMPGVRRVILSTNIAESSLTIPYVDYVFDFCLTKVLKLNRITKVPQLSLEWASVSNSYQRRGRVGRVRRGRVYFFVPRRFFNESLPRHPEPEILISPMDHTVLRVKQLKVTPPPAEVLVLMPDPPDRNDVERAILSLKQAGALTVKFNGQPSYTDGDVTVLGSLLARFPMDIPVAKFLVLCCMFGYAQEGVTVAAGLSVESVLSNENFRSVERCKRLHNLYGRYGSHSDALALLYAYERWATECENCTFATRLDEKRWCEQHLIDLSRMKEFVALRRELWHRLTENCHFPDTASKMPFSKEVMIPLLLAGAFHKNILINKSTVSDVATGKQLLGYNPLHTCVIPRFGYNSPSPAPLYDAQLKQILGLNTSGESVARVVYGSNETFICFARYAGNIVYGMDATKLHRGVEVLKKRMAELRGTLALCDQGESEELQKLLKGSNMIDPEIDTRFCLREDIIRLPPAEMPVDSEGKLPVAISDIENVELFWLAHWDAENSARQLEMRRTITEIHTRQGGLRPAKRDALVLFNSYLSQHDGCNEFARVTLFGLPDSVGNVQILLVDSGILDRVPAEWLYILPLPARTVPRACFEFSFTGLRFIESKTAAAAAFIKKFVAADDAELMLQVHSIVDGVVYGTIHWSLGLMNGVSVNLNEELIKLGYAYQGSPSWISQYDHNRRLNGSSPVPLPSSYDVAEKDIPVTEKKSNLVNVGPPIFPVLGSLETIGRNRISANVEPGSLNALSYEKHPEDRCWPYRPVVAARLVHAGARDNMLKAFSTALLPTQPGLLPILTMVFAPYVEVIAENGGSFVGVLSGLGPHPGKSHSFFPDCEVELPFDGEVTARDIIEVNNLRSKMNAVLRLITSDNPDQSAVHIQQESCVRLLITLLDKPRRLLSPRLAAYTWTEMNHDLTDDAAAQTFLVPIECGLLTEDDDQDLFANVVALHRTLKGYLENEAGATETDPVEHRCLLCGLQLPRPDLLIQHLYSEEHLVKERQLLRIKTSSSKE
ncbi:putative ATP-dependent RNA helicase spindle-E [Hypsibius exemplaris]|uniref:ATP-dependent RNA helicase spindle-E n=1 Tax=Hypsibius exemplaris TaxID=2072580 RepID=A0A1W0WWL8_HYPEX|nr:putative ATP-dependent RNA helicase spindle-E [Hypsibius exemplaris]